MKKNRFRKLSVIIVLCLVGLWLVLFLAKGWLLDLAMAKVQQKLRDKYHAELKISHYALEGWNVLTMDGIDCRDAKNDTLATLDHLQLNIKIWPLVAGRLRLDKMTMNGGRFDLKRLGNLRKGEPSAAGEQKDSNLFVKVHKYVGLLKDAADLVPDNFLAKKIYAYYADTSGNWSGYIDSLSYVDSRLASKSVFSIGGQRQTWIATGSFDKSSLETHLKVNSDVTGFYRFDMIKRLASAKIGFRSYSIDISNLKDDDNETDIIGSVKANKILVYNPRLSSDTIGLDSGGMDFSVKLNAQKLLVDSTSRLHINGLSVMVSSDYEYVYPSKIRAKISLPPVAAQSILDAMPSGAFETVHSMTLDGNLGYNLDFYLNIDTKDSINIDAHVINQGLHVVNYGSADLPKINGNFVYHPYNSRRPILVDSANPEYARLSALPKYLVDAIVGSEDPNFFYNRGIEPDAIEVSFLQNLKLHRFRQGGSTITMQLVKNVFLTHKKTIDRKLEEFFLVWLMENTHITSKNRILEVYLNIIEWGPDVYGIGEAAKFYFNKKPSELTLNESIFLAKIIPQPLGFMNRFDDQGNLKPNFQRKALNTVDRMARRGNLDIEAEGSYWPEVKITGPAKNLIKISPAVDSLRIQDSLRRENDW